MSLFSKSGSSGGSLGILKEGPAARVLFFYSNEEGTYVDNAHVTVYENGIVHLVGAHEETTTHLHNCEILWDFEVEGHEHDPKAKVRLLKPRGGEPRVPEPRS